MGERLRQLAEIAYRLPERGGCCTVHVSREDLAALAGTTRPRANRVLREFERGDAVKLGRGRIEVLEPRTAPRPGALSSRRGRVRAPGHGRVARGCHGRDRARMVAETVLAPGLPGWARGRREGLWGAPSP
jgi:Crp-like helix-turn-helix domain